MTIETEDLIRLAEQDPLACIDLCRQLIEKGDSLRRTAEAHRALGIAHRHLGEVERSISELVAARDLFQELEEDVDAAESVVSLAASVAISGRLDEAVDSLEPILAHADALVRSHAQAQKAGLIARTGDLRGALVLYELAHPELEKAKDHRWLAVLHSTRGLVHTYLSDFAAAESDLRSSRSLFTEMGRFAFAAEQLHNLGFVAVMRGDTAAGLSLLMEAEEEFHRAGLPIEAILSDRSHAYMLAGLARQALKVALATARRMKEEGRALDQAEALYTAAKAALADGDFGAAMELADETARLAGLQVRTLWRLLAEAIGEEARWRAGDPGDPARLVELARDFSNQGNPSGEAHAIALAALRELEQGDPLAARTYVDSIDGDSALELTVRLLLATARARTSLASGDNTAALGILRAAADLVDEHRLVLAATEARAGVSRLADEIAALGLQALGEGSPSLVDWTERFRGASLRIAPVVMSSDTELAIALAELRGAVRDLEQLRLQGEDVRDPARQVQQLEARIRDLALAREEKEAFSSPILPLAEVAEALGSSRMLYIYEMNGRFFGQMVGVETGDVSQLGKAGQIRSLAQHLAAALRREFMVRPGDPGKVDDMVGELGAHLLGQATEAGGGVVVVPPPDLVSLPWNAMAAAVDPDLGVVVAPSAGMWLQASRQSRRDEGVAVVAGPRLAFASVEATKVAELYEDEANLLTGDAATVEAVSQAMARSDIFHAVAHTRLRHDNPMFSALELADGFLNLYDLEAVSTMPGTVVLSACESAHGNIVGGHEMYGLTSILLSRGARSIIATVAPIPDAEVSVAAVERIHAALRGGSGASAALRQALGQRASSAVDPTLAFVAYGA